MRMTLQLIQLSLRSSLEMNESLVDGRILDVIVLYVMIWGFHSFRCNHFNAMNGDDL
jgi:hypothetical protein